MGLKKSLLAGIVAFVVAAAVARAASGNRRGTRIGLLTGGAVALSTLVSGRGDDGDADLEDELAAE